VPAIIIKADFMRFSLCDYPGACPGEWLTVLAIIVNGARREMKRPVAVNRPEEAKMGRPSGRPG
jgi:hypothetical protein